MCPALIGWRVAAEGHVSWLAVVGEPHVAGTPNLQRRLQQTLGADAAGDLVTWMHGMDAHRNDIADFRQETKASFARIEQRFEKIDQRLSTYDERFARVEGRMETMQKSMEHIMEKGLREQTRFFFLAWSVLLAAIVGLYART
jgi:hypothetical protein